MKDIESISQFIADVRGGALYEIDGRFFLIKRTKRGKTRIRPLGRAGAKVRIKEVQSWNLQQD